LCQDAATMLLQDMDRRDDLVYQVMHLDARGNVVVAMQDDLGIRFGEAKPDGVLVAPDRPHLEDIDIIIGGRIQVVTTDHHAVDLSQHAENPRENCKVYLQLWVHRTALLYPRANR